MWTEAMPSSRPRAALPPTPTGTTTCSPIRRYERRSAPRRSTWSPEWPRGTSGSASGTRRRPRTQASPTTSGKRPDRSRSSCWSPRRRRDAGKTCTIMPLVARYSLAPRWMPMIYRSCRIECVWSGEANDGGNNDVRVIGAPNRSSHHHLDQLHSKWFDQMIDYGSSQLAFAEGASARIWPIDEHANIRRVFFSLVVPLVMVVAVIGLTVWRIMLARWTTVLEGDQLVFRRAGKELRCDLATADLRLDWTNLVERRTRTAS